MGEIAIHKKTQELSGFVNIYEHLKNISWNESKNSKMVSGKFAQK